MPMPLVTAAVALALGARPLVPAVAGSSPPSGPWRWPLAGPPVVARPFEPPPGPWAAGHRGVDLAAPPESPVLSAGAGVVSFAGYVAGTGVVSVRHADGLRTTYEPVLPAVHVGASVAGGDLLGHLMPGHGDCGPGRWCLHWGLLRGSTYLDPLTLVRRGPVRLLPLRSGDAIVSSTDGQEAPAWPHPRGEREAWSASSDGGAARFPQTGTPATTPDGKRKAWSASSGGGAARFPETGIPATSSAAPRGFRATALGAWLSGGAGLAGLLAWWSTPSPLRRGAFRDLNVTAREITRRCQPAVMPRPT